MTGLFKGAIKSLSSLRIQPAPDTYTVLCRGVYSSIIPPPPWGGGKESKGLRAREENQRRVEKMERQREKKRKISVGNS
jgi:hypothetical protein